MATLEMKGAYSLDEKTLEKILDDDKIGNYGLGYIDEEDSFIVEYVGRSDDNLKERLTKHIGSYKKFKYSYANSIKEAFEKECKNYHDFNGTKGKLDNKIHPARPKGKEWECPRCTIFDEE